MDNEPNSLTDEQAQNAWDEAVAQITGETAEQPPQQQPQEPADPEPAAQPTEQLADDPLQLRADLDAMRAQLADQEEWRKRVREADGTIGGLRQQINELKAAQDAIKSQPTAEQVAAAEKSAARWKQLRDDFPEWAEAMDDRLSELKNEFSKPAVDPEAIRKQLREEIETEYQKRRAEDAAALEVRLVDVTHRGWRDLVKTPEFKTWKSAQSADIQALAASDKADDAIDLLDRYKAAQKTTTATADEIAAQRKQRLKSAALPTGKGASTPAKAEEDMTDDEYWEFYTKKVMTARGR